MARPFKKLSARAVATLTEPGRHSDGAGLYLSIDKEGRRRWVFMFPWKGKRTEMGLGSAITVSLARARELADAARRLVAEGRNPIEARDAAKAGRASKPTFGTLAEQLMNAKRSEWRNNKHGSQWETTLRDYCKPLWSQPVDEIDTAAVLSVLTPRWGETYETASRVRGRIEKVIDSARALGHIPPDRANPARWKGHLDHILPKKPRLAQAHHAAMDYGAVPAFMARLRSQESVAALALAFTILTAARSGEVLGAKWNEIDMVTKIWTVPPSRMKAGREHRVPLCQPALAILEAMSAARTGKFVFPGQTTGALSHGAMARVLERMGVTDATPHGFRSSFCDWAGNETSFPREIAEQALAHVVGNAVEAAYRRSDALEKRRELMAAWASYLQPRDESNVVPIRSASVA